MVNSKFLDSPKPHLLAHRGGNAAGSKKENTIAAFRSAVELGYHYLETDVIYTKDNQVLAYHGAKNHYQARKTGLILRRKLEAMTYDEIQSYTNAGGEPLPLLSEILDAFPEAMIKIDAKTNRVAAPLIELLRSRNEWERVAVGTFNPLRMRKIKQMLSSEEKGVCLVLSISSTTMLFLRCLGLFGAYIATTPTDVVEVAYKFINPRIVRVVQGQNKLIYAWTVNGSESIQRMLRLGVDGIFSDDTELLKQIAGRSK